MPFPRYVVDGEPWNKNKLVGQKLALKQQQIWAIRIRLENNAEVIKDWIQSQTEDLDGLQDKGVLKMLIEKFYLQVNDSFTDFL